MTNEVNFTVYNPLNSYYITVLKRKDEWYLLTTWL